MADVKATTKLKMRRTTKAGYRPKADNLLPGELFINLADQTISTSNGSSVIDIGGGGGGGGAGITNGELIINKYGTTSNKGNLVLSADKDDIAIDNPNASFITIKKITALKGTDTYQGAKFKADSPESSSVIILANNKGDAVISASDSEDVDGNGTLAVLSKKIIIGGYGSGLIAGSVFPGIGGEVFINNATIDAKTITTSAASFFADGTRIRGNLYVEGDIISNAPPDESTEHRDLTVQNLTALGNIMSWGGVTARNASTFNSSITVLGQSNLANVSCGDIVASGPAKIARKLTVSHPNQTEAMYLGIDLVSDWQGELAPQAVLSTGQSETIKFLTKADVYGKDSSFATLEAKDIHLANGSIRGANSIIGLKTISVSDMDEGIYDTHYGAGIGKSYNGITLNNRVGAVNSLASGLQFVQNKAIGINIKNEDDGMGLVTDYNASYTKLKDDEFVIGTSIGDGFKGVTINNVKETNAGVTVTPSVGSTTVKLIEANYGNVAPHISTTSNSISIVPTESSKVTFSDSGVSFGSQISAPSIQLGQATVEQTGNILGGTWGVDLKSYINNQITNAHINLEATTIKLPEATIGFDGNITGGVWGTDKTIKEYIDANAGSGGGGGGGRKEAVQVWSGSVSGAANTSPMTITSTEDGDFRCGGKLMLKESTGAWLEYDFDCPDPGGQTGTVQFNRQIFSQNTGASDMILAQNSMSGTKTTWSLYGHARKTYTEAWWRPY